MCIFLYVFALIGIYFIEIAWYFILDGVVAILVTIFLMKKDVSQKIEKKKYSAYFGGKEYV